MERGAQNNSSRIAEGVWHVTWCVWCQQQHKRLQSSTQPAG
jgi:hypothetical protein